MTQAGDNTNLQAYNPVYDVVPEKWEEGRQFLVEQLRNISQSINVREIGWYLDEELLSGKAFIPGVNDVNAAGTSERFRAILRKVIVFPGLTVGLNSQPHGINIDSNFTLIDMFVCGTDETALTGGPIPNADITYDQTNVYITVAAAYTRANAIMEYIVEL